MPRSSILNRATVILFLSVCPGGQLHLASHATHPDTFENPT